MLQITTSRPGGQEIFKSRRNLNLIFSLANYLFGSHSTYINSQDGRSPPVFTGCFPHTEPYGTSTNTSEIIANCKLIDQ